MTPPGQIIAYEVVCHLEDVWAYHRFKGRFAIVKTPAEVGGAAGTGSALAYVDTGSGEWGPLLNPASSRWQHPPYGFPTAFFVPLSSGACIWLRVEGSDELRICYRNADATMSQSDSASSNHHLAAFRAAPRREHEKREPTVLSFLCIGMWHAFADGNCHLPLAQDLFTFYEAARGVSVPIAAPIGNPMEELERRLFDTFHCRPAPLRKSVRGSLWQYRGVGYGHILGLAPGATNAVARCAAKFRVPLDVALLAMAVCALAVADDTEVVEFTLYAPMRDGLLDSMSVGLFSDWRDLALGVDRDLATTLGTTLQVYHKIQHRQWSVYNALKKPEAMVVNVQPLDFSKRAGFVNLGEHMWRHGDQLGAAPRQREKNMDWVPQPATLVIEQQDTDTWWVLASAGHTERPTPWMRRFIFGFHEALRTFCTEPTTLVHRPLPSDGELLRLFDSNRWLSEKEGRVVIGGSPAM